MVMTYIEWESKKFPVPDWCPLRLNHGKKQNEQENGVQDQEQTSRVAKNSGTQRTLPGI